MLLNLSSSDLLFWSLSTAPLLFSGLFLLKDNHFWEQLIHLEIVFKFVMIRCALKIVIINENNLDLHVRWAGV